MHTLTIISLHSAFALLGSSSTLNVGALLAWIELINQTSSRTQQHTGIDLDRHKHGFSVVSTREAAGGGGGGGAEETRGGGGSGWRRWRGGDARRRRRKRKT